MRTAQTPPAKCCFTSVSHDRNYLGSSRPKPPASSRWKPAPVRTTGQREIGKLGHKARLIPPAYVKLFVKRQKNDAADAEAICEAAQRPSMRFVPVKDEEQQANGVVFRARDLLVHSARSASSTLWVIWTRPANTHAGQQQTIAASQAGQMAASDYAPPQSRSFPLPREGRPQMERGRSWQDS
jgi:hypothetical protein